MDERSVEQCDGNKNMQYIIKKVSTFLLQKVFFAEKKLFDSFAVQATEAGIRKKSSF